MCTTSAKNRAILLLGPTGAGKTPLGKIIEQRGLWQTRCVHFDFGANLRDLVYRNQPSETIGRQDIDFLREVLDSGALLEDEHFPIAERILKSFLAARAADRQTYIVLNGLPRHVGQARAVDSILDVRAVVHLVCSSETVIERIRTNVGGDRSGRVDDDLQAVRNKLAIFNRRTATLLEHYDRQGARIVTLDVTTADLTPVQMWEILNHAPGKPDFPQVGVTAK